MQMLYDSESFVVVHLVANQDPDALPLPMHRRRNCFEIVDKRSNMEVLLDGSWADAFQRQINAWQLNTPAEAEVESVLEGYAHLAQIPLSIQ